MVISYVRELELKLQRAEADSDQWKLVAGILAADLAKRADAALLAPLYAQMALDSLIAPVWERAAWVLRDAQQTRDFVARELAS